MYTAFGFHYKGHISKAKVGMLGSVIDVPLVTTFALVKHRRAFIGASKLLCVVTNFWSTTLVARMIDLAGGLNVSFHNNLNLRSLSAES